MQQRKSVNFEEWKAAYKEGFDGFVLKCGDATAPDYADQFRAEECVESVHIRHDGVHVVFKREKPEVSEKEKEVTDLLGYAGIFMAGFMVSFVITFFVMY